VAQSYQSGLSKKFEFYHEPHEPIRTTTRYVQKVRDFRVVRGRIFSFWTSPFFLICFYTTKIILEMVLCG